MLSPDVLQFVVIGVFLLTIGALIVSHKRPSFIFSLTTLALLLCGAVDIDTVLDNATNQGLITLLLLLIISHAIDKTALLKRIARKLITQNYTQSFLRLFGISFFASALLNNTAIVASLIGSVKQNQHHAASKLLIPLSYAAILGGTVTLIGTSTNLIVDSFLIEQGHPGFAFFDFTMFGLTAGLVCGGVLFLLKDWLPTISPGQQADSGYLLEAEVAPESELIGNTVEQNHLRNLPELFLAEIVRNDQIISPVTPDEVIYAGDKLLFSGNVQKVEALSHIKGLCLFAEYNGLMREELTEVVISNRSSIIGKTLKKVGFRALFDAAVVAIKRDGETLSGKLGEITLQSGDFLILATGKDFQQRNNIAKHFFIVSEQKISRKLSSKQDWFTIGGFLTVVTLAAANIVPLIIGLLFFLALLVMLDVTSYAEVKRNLPLNLLLVIVGALSLSSGLVNSGVIALLTDELSNTLIQTSPLMALIAIYVCTLLLTEFVTNNAAAALMFPFAWALIETMGLPVMPFALAVAFAASASFISPYGYQTNLLVHNAGDYQYKHFVKMGLPISIMYSTIVIGMLNWVYL
jgi:di/tricarboxylate transporter